MKRIVQSPRRASAPRRPGLYRPHLETLEDRLPPGDVLLGAVLGSSWLASSLSLLKADPLPAALAGTGELPTGHRQAYSPAPLRFR